MCYLCLETVPQRRLTTRRAPSASLRGSSTDPGQPGVAFSAILALAGRAAHLRPLGGHKTLEMSCCMRYTRIHAFHFVILACTLLVSSGCSSADAIPSSRPGHSGPLVLPPATTSSTSTLHPTSGFATSPATPITTRPLPSPAVLPTVFSSQ